LKKKLGIIGGSGLYEIDGFSESSWETIKTPWGNPSDQILNLKFNDQEVCFMPRHGRGHTVSPSNINFRANIDALKQKGVTDIISVSAVGSLKDELPPGKFVLIDQFIDRTYARTNTFFDEEIVAHVSMAQPTSNDLTRLCSSALDRLKVDYQHGGLYLAMEGPQFSSKAESILYKSWGVDVIGMTNMPEAKLAKEAEIRYCTVAMVTDFDCWHPNHDHVDIDMIIKVLKDNAGKAKSMIKDIISNFEFTVHENDDTHKCLDTAIITAPDKMTEKTKNKLKTIAGRVLFSKNED
jgi:5'-methylthioadenosine phosphorylase